MKYDLALRCDPGCAEYEPAIIRSASSTLAHHGAQSGGVTIVLTGAESIRELNRTFAGEDHPTDVLAFIDGTSDPETGEMYYGDVVIAVDVARDQAVQAGHTLASELSLLTVHGVLHLLGHDHADPEGKQKMWAVQEEILDSLDVSLGDGSSER